MLEAAEETRRDEGWASETAGAGRHGPRGAAAGAPFVAADLDEALERGDDGR